MHLKLHLILGLIGASMLIDGQRLTRRGNYTYIYNAIATGLQIFNITLWRPL